MNSTNSGEKQIIFQWLLSWCAEKWPWILAGLLLLGAVLLTAFLLAAERKKKKYAAAPGEAGPECDETPTFPVNEDGLYRPGDFKVLEDITFVHTDGRIS